LTNCLFIFIKYHFRGIAELKLKQDFYKNKLTLKKSLHMTPKQTTTKNQKDEQLQKLNDYRLKKLIQALSISADTNMTRIYTAIKLVE
jgi:hypothetical protein